MSRRYLILLVLLLLVPAFIVLAQRRGRRDRGDRDSRRGVPHWQQDKELPRDVFTFARVKYSSWSDGWRGGKWETDYPDSDLNFSYRLQELTSLEVDPDGVIVELTDEDLQKYPFLYVIEPGTMDLTEAEREGLRKYCLNGGFVMVDDFWGEDEWDNFHSEMKRVFPKLEPKELEVKHEIFTSVFEMKEKPQVPSLQMALRGRHEGITWERWDAETPHYKALYDDAGRMMMVICHNTDLGDGWEREGENEWYFKNFSEPKAFPMGINIVFYALTH